MRKVIHPDFPDYFVCEDGTVERAVNSKKYHKRGDRVFGRILKSGYRQFNIRDRAGNRKLIRANRLVCAAFHGPAPASDSHAAHINGDRLDNSASNLRWATPTENIVHDRNRHGTVARGVKAANQYGPAKLTNQAVANIKANYSGKRGEIADFARQHGVHETCIRKIVCGETWAHIPGRSTLDRQRPRP